MQMEVKVILFKQPKENENEIDETENSRRKQLGSISKQFLPPPTILVSKLTVADISVPFRNGES